MSEKIFNKKEEDQEEDFASLVSEIHQGLTDKYSDLLLTVLTNILILSRIEFSVDSQGLSFSEAKKSFLEKIMENLENYEKKHHQSDVKEKKSFIDDEGFSKGFDTAIELVMSVLNNSEAKATQVDIIVEEITNEVELFKENG